MHEIQKLFFKVKDTKHYKGCLNGVASVKENAPFDERYRRLDSRDGQYYFTLTAKNNKVIGVSETYTTKAARDSGIEAVKQEAPCAIIENLTESDGGRISDAQHVGEAESSGGLLIKPKRGNCKTEVLVRPKGGVYGSSY